MEIIAPNHILEFCYIAHTDKLFLDLRKDYEDNLSYIYKIKCNCGNEKFYVYNDASPGVYAKCPICNRMITIYDLDYYPAAVKLNKHYEKELVEDKLVNVYVNFEYDDEYTFEDDVEFDMNDICWGKVFIGDNNGLKLILDDETA